VAPQIYRTAATRDILFKLAEANAAVQTDEKHTAMFKVVKVLPEEDSFIVKEDLGEETLYTVGCAREALQHLQPGDRIVTSIGQEKPNGPWLVVEGGSLYPESTVECSAEAF
jgi:hypothetical protein